MPSKRDENKIWPNKNLLIFLIDLVLNILDHSHSPTMIIFVSSTCAAQRLKSFLGISQVSRFSQVPSLAWWNKEANQFGCWNHWYKVAFRRPIWNCVHLISFHIRIIKCLSPSFLWQRLDEIITKPHSVRRKLSWKIWHHLFDMQILVRMHVFAQCMRDTLGVWILLQSWPLSLKGRSYF